ncbi:MAG TPA: ABC transporter substrate-binding protein, partial [Burkholderiaceae bacterium]|nr:ABC transporter substrate-binding protein [Burkholderiaceae bacterium]
MKRRLFLSLPLCCCTAGMASEAAQRIVSLGGTITEIVFALGAGDRLVGADSSSLYPEAATRLPQVGYFRGFAVEGVVSLQPGLVLASEGAGPPQALAQLSRLGVRVVTIPSKANLESLFDAIGRIADAIGRPERGTALVARIRSELDQALAAAGTDDRADAAPAPRALVLSSHTGRLQAAGSDTAANAVLALAGIANAFDTQTGYKSISAETVTALQPEIIVTSPLSMGDGGLAAFASLPGIATTPAARRGRIVVIDDLLLLGFGPRVPQAL